MATFIGPPSKAVITAEFQESGGLKVFWVVQSISPILETDFRYRQVHSYIHQFPYQLNWNKDVLFKAKDVDFRQTVVTTEHCKYVNSPHYDVKYYCVTVYGTEYKAEHSIEKYVPDAEYIVQVKSRNTHGWSDMSLTSLHTGTHKQLLENSV